eukprot:CAMPEP_0206547334 /NCGR_PEP_ID=MMETSP0325_2-20121206/13234_1 /ASSEMBLY_ACC=CAM_ASM_000347 /TAXON_ID=2866 /ORGANISM="Crypthecodinium cohnii, Strain Seligo" /LENGTH=200 /DNA_ID=CAMNT_0054046619 /DNA_START=52 /DNA_END=650 /DNA_ORIENTATION=-
MPFWGRYAVPGTACLVLGALANHALDGQVVDDLSDVAEACAFDSKNDEETHLRLLQRRALQKHADARAVSSSTEALKAAFLDSLYSSRRCDDGPGDLRDTDVCALERCQRCMGGGAELEYDEVKNYTTCTYHTSNASMPSTFCGESFGDGRANEERVAKCTCCYPNGHLSFSAADADGLGYTLLPVALRFLERQCATPDA